MMNILMKGKFLGMTQTWKNERTMSTIVKRPHSLYQAGKLIKCIKGAKKKVRMSFSAEMSEDTIMENGDSGFSNTDALIFNSADISGGDPSMISGPNMAASSSSSFMSVGHHHHQQISTASGRGDDDELIVSNASSRILNDDFREVTSIGGGAVNNETSNMLVPISLACFEAIQQNNLNLADSLIADLTKFADSQTGDMMKVATDFAQALDRMIIRGTNNPQRRSLRLKFLRRLSVPVITGMKIKGKRGTAIHVVLVDGVSGQIVDHAPQASATVEIVVLRGDFGGDNWTSGEFNSNIVRDRADINKPLLAETVPVRLNRGIGLIDKIRFAHYSSYMRSNVFCLGARVIECFDGTQLKEAKTKPFTVRDARTLGTLSNAINVEPDN